MASCTTSASASASAGMGTPTSRPDCSPSLSSCVWHTAAASATSAATIGAAQPDERVKKAGNSSVPRASTATPCVSRYSSVRGMSRIDLIPALTTSTGVRPSSTTSADTSIELSPPRCTPPMPPVTKTAMPALCASSIVLLTVVPPCALRATACARSRLDTLRTSPAEPSCAKRSSSSSVRPMQHTPSRIAMVAGVAPQDRTTSSTSRAVLRLSGYGIPCEMIVDSRATTGRRSASARFTSG
mmetsp:Transcript_8340/g.19662  ORF Transcript_8340/g.19662 Transcript_8340/m.19662 type:complete len:242 (-) Transcript_8340:96-821(-)|eukprot:scaffold53600_cov64-Phaeocystis_antarctica.AAC.5